MEQQDAGLGVLGEKRVSRKRLRHTSDEQSGRGGHRERCQNGCSRNAILKCSGDRLLRKYGFELIGLDTHAYSNQDIEKKDVRLEFGLRLG